MTQAKALIIIITGVSIVITCRVGRGAFICYITCTLQDYIITNLVYSSQLLYHASFGGMISVPLYCVSMSARTTEPNSLHSQVLAKVISVGLQVAVKAN